jgi:hypothetical protein
MLTSQPTRLLIRVLLLRLWHSTNPMITRRSFRTVVPLLLLTTQAAADYMYGHVSQVEDNRFSISTRFFPKVGFGITDQTEFLCHRDRVPLKALRVGDLVDVDFRSTKHKWEAVRVKIRANKRDCSARSQGGP